MALESLKTPLRIAAVNAGGVGADLTLFGPSYQKAYLEVAAKTGETVVRFPLFTPKKLWFQFNPAEITIDKKVNWVPSGGDAESDEGGTPAYFEKTTYTPPGSNEAKQVTIYHPGSTGTQPDKNAPTLEFKGGEVATYSLELLFDTTDKQPGTSARDVRRHTNDLLALTIGKEKNEAELYPPPPVDFVWGKFRLFRAVVESVSISYTMFDTDGTPVRATAETGFLEWVEEKTAQNPTTRTEPRKTWIVQQGQTLHQIAQAEYGHPGYWRHLADSNDLLNPLTLQPGQVLILPPLP